MRMTNADSHHELRGPSYALEAASDRKAQGVELGRCLAGVEWERHIAGGWMTERGMQEGSGWGPGWREPGPWGRPVGT